MNTTAGALCDFDEVIRRIHSTRSEQASSSLKTLQQP